MVGEDDEAVQVDPDGVAEVHDVLHAQHALEVSCQRSTHLHEENALDDDGDPLLSMYLKPEHYIPALADCWRSDESYWLRSTPSAYLSDETYAEQGMSSESTRDEYFLQADSAGNIHAAHYDDTAAVRLIFTVK